MTTVSMPVDAAAVAIEPRVIAWRRDFHAHPELGNREFRTSKIVAGHLRALGIEVTTGVAHTGVVGVLRGTRPGPCVALRADMDALPVAEEVDLPFASRVRTEYNKEDVGVMHACGHDAHTAILMGVAELLAQMRDQLAGTVKFIFQPAEEGPPEGEEGGAALMVKEGVLDSEPKPQAIFGLHVISPIPTGMIGIRPGPLMAAVDNFDITIEGRQTHAAMPWLGVDPIVAAAQVITGLQQIVSREVDLSEDPAVLTIGAIKGGVRENIIPDNVQMKGTIRTFNDRARSQVGRRLQEVATHIACGCGAKARVHFRTGYPVTVNHAALTKWSMSTLGRVAGEKNVLFVPKVLGGEDFSYFQQRIPGVFFFLGCTPHGRDPAGAAANHSPRFFVDEQALVLGVRALTQLTIDYLAAPPAL
jgi:amidohydrolase